jgi:hypothetical protein
LFFFGLYRVWGHCFPLVRQVLCWLRHATSPVCSSYFWERVSLLPRLAWTTILLIYASQPSLGWDVCATMPRFFPLRWDLTSFFPQTNYDHDSPDLSSSAAWDDRCMSPCPTISWDGGSHNLLAEACLELWSFQSQPPK